MPLGIRGKASIRLLSKGPFKDCRNIYEVVIKPGKGQLKESELFGDVRNE